MGVQYLRTDGGEELVVVPRAVWEQLVAEVEDAEDIAAIREMEAAIEAGRMETFPGELVFAISNGANAVRSFRDFRGLTVEALAETAGLSRAYVTQIETGVRTGTAATLAKLAKALGVDVELLICSQD